MPRSFRTASILSTVVLLPLIGGASPRVRSEMMLGFDPGSGVGFQLIDPPLGPTHAPNGRAKASLAGSTIAGLPGGALVIDSDSGKLLRVDRTGKAIGSLDIGMDASQLVHDAKKHRAYVVDRSHDRVVVVDTKDDLKVVDAFRTAAEPFGVALSPDGATLLVTTVADKQLLAFDTASGDRKWSVELGPEPRGVAISPAGDQALVTFLTTGVVARVSLAGEPKMTFVSLDPPPPERTAVANKFQHVQVASVNEKGKVKAGDHDPNLGRSFARNAFAAAFVGNGLAVVPHQISTPHLASDGFEVERSGYGGGNGFTAPINHRLAFLETPDAGSSADVRLALASTSSHQPRAMAYDAGSDTLYIAGYGSDDVIAVADVSQSGVHLGWQAPLRGDCAPDGLSVDPENGDVLAFCSLTRSVVRLSGDPDSVAAPTVSYGGEIAKSRHTESELRGKQIFRDGRNPQISTFGAMACTSCHAEARSDGLTWFLQGNTLQTPFLSGRLAGTHPFKWDGQDADLKTSLTNTVTRLGGSGITGRDAKDLQAFLTSVPRPRTPTVEDSSAVARGKELFESSTTGCLNCHDGALSSDGKRHDIATDLPAVDTPSLIGLAQSAPYYHDGSAETLDSLLRNNGTIHSMGRTSRLDDAQITDLVAYLETM